MELQGKIIAALDVRSGESARGPWKAQDFVLETNDTYPRKMVFSVFGADRLERFNIQIGQDVTVLFDIDAHEYNGRWFNSIRAYDVRLTSQMAPQTPYPSAAPAPQGDPLAPAMPSGNTASSTPQNSDDDLPF